MLQCYNTTLQVILHSFKKTESLMFLSHLPTVRDMANIFRKSFQVYNNVSSLTIWAMATW
jgi:hypothetical protein